MLTKCFLISSRASGNSETAMEYFGCAVLGRKLVCLFTEFSKEIQIPVHSNCIKSMLNLEFENVLGWLEITSHDTLFHYILPQKIRNQVFFLRHNHCDTNSSTGISLLFRSVENIPIKI